LQRYEKEFIYAIYLVKNLLVLKRYSIEYLICVPPGTIPAAV
jgi:hypothetical protein